MLVDGRKIQNGSSFNFDICIIGAGAAGITLARSLNNLNKSICLLESGGFDFSLENNNLYQGEISGETEFMGDNYLTRTRLRMFGGTTNHWAGTCRPLDEYDFEKRPWISESIGWPFKRDVLIPYYEKAARIVEIDPFFSGQDERKVFFNKDCELIALPFHFSPPTRFGSTYRKELKASKNTSIFLRANATEFRLNKSKTQVQHINIVRANKARFRINARIFILATGGLENPRLLLNSNKDIKVGLGNQNDLVGRYFMSHSPLQKLTSAVFSGEHTKQVVTTLFKPSNTQLSIREDIKQKKQLLNLGLQFRAKIHNEEKIEDLRRFGHLKTAFDKNYHIPKAFKLLRVNVIAEQSPNRDSRVMLSDTKDYTGIRRLNLQYKTNPEDRINIEKSLKIAVKELGRLGLGRLQISFDQASEIPFAPDDHHMGTTRMHNNPKLGVVDANCKVHGIENLYIAGSSVFPSAGFANPTFTIIALTLRLSDHLKSKIT